MRIWIATVAAAGLLSTGCSTFGLLCPLLLQPELCLSLGEDAAQGEDED